MKSAPEEQERLITLQTLDTLLTQLAHKAKTLPVIAALEIVTISHNSTRDLVIAAETEKADIKHELTKSEVDVEQVVARIDKDEKRMASGTASPKELEQLQHEVGTLGVRRAELEEVELEVMMRIDEINSRITELSAQETAFATEIADLEIRKENALAAFNTELESISKERAATLSTVAPDFITLYEKIRTSNNGTGAAALIAGTCNGCHLSINAVELKRIIDVAEDEVIRCEECRCILVRGV